MHQSTTASSTSQCTRYGTLWVGGTLPTPLFTRTSNSVLPKPYLPHSFARTTACTHTHIINTRGTHTGLPNKSYTNRKPRGWRTNTQIDTDRQTEQATDERLGGGSGAQRHTSSPLNRSNYQHTHTQRIRYWRDSFQMSRSYRERCLLDRERRINALKARPPSTKPRH